MSINGQYVLVNPDTVDAFEYTGQNYDDLLEWGQGMVHGFPDERVPFIYDDGTDHSTDIEPGQVVLQFHDGTFGVMSKRDFNRAYEPAT